MITNVYIDGFNLYYGCLKRSPYKWLDLGSLCSQLLPQNDIKRIRYFTARVKARPDNPLAPARQDAYLAALESIPNLTVHLGHFLVSETRMPLAPIPARPPKTVLVTKTEEKGSDVNLATYLLADAFRADCEASVVITNDSDLAEPMRMVSQELGLTVGLVNPHPRQASRALINIGKPRFVKAIRGRHLAASQFPDHVMVGRRTLHRPSNW